MRLYIEPDRKTWAGLCVRPDTGAKEIDTKVRQIVRKVKTGGDKALKSISEEIDGYPLGEMKVSQEEISAAASQVPRELRNAIITARSNIEIFTNAQMTGRIEVQTMPGVRCWQRSVPIAKVGLYIPGGTAPLFSSVLMLAIPAKIAGCSRVTICTPRGKDGSISPAILYAASLCGVTDIYGIGGAQAIAAMAYGTKTIPKVDKIFGPGNRYVSKAKRVVSEDGVAVDMFAGPTELLIIADDSARADFLAADLLSQAEHGKDSQVCLVCDSQKLLEEVNKELKIQIERIPRREIAEAALAESLAIIIKDKDTMLDFANTYAPEHLIINTNDAWALAGAITAAGNVFIGPYSPESAGDYASGTNHTLPTAGTATTVSGVGLESFMHKITYQELTKDGLDSLAPTIMDMAKAEGLIAHANSVAIRVKE